MKEVALAEAKDRLSALIQEVEDTGEEIVITKHGRPAVRLTRARRTERTPEERRASRRELIRIRDQMARDNPEAAKPIPWETVKSWMYGEDE